jgi:hypothetical protein
VVTQKRRNDAGFTMTVRLVLILFLNLQLSSLIHFKSSLLTLRSVAYA